MYLHHCHRKLISHCHAPRLHPERNGFREAGARAAAGLRLQARLVASVSDVSSTTRIASCAGKSRPTELVIFHGPGVGRNDRPTND